MTHHPQDGWERSSALLTLSADELAAMLRPAFGASHVIRTEVLSGGLANTNVKVELSGQSEPYVVRAYTRDQTTCGREVDVLAFVRAEAARSALPRVPVPDVVYADAAGAQTGRPYVVMSWCPGISLASALAAATDTELTALGAMVGSTAATLSRIALPWCGELGPGMQPARDWGSPRAATLEHVHACLFGGRAGLRLGELLRDRLWRLVESRAPALDALHDDYSLLHGDFKEPNMLVICDHGTWQLSGLLDWEFACAGPTLIDLGTLLRHRLLSGDPFTDAVVATFAKLGGRLPANWRLLARLLDVNALCTFLSQFTDRPRVFADAKELLARTLACLENDG